MNLKYKICFGHDKVQSSRKLSITSETILSQKHTKSDNLESTDVSQFPEILPCESFQVRHHVVNLFPHAKRARITVKAE